MTDKQNVTFSEEQFSKLFPFYLRVNDRLEIVAMGRSLQKLKVAQPGDAFQSAFSIQRPQTDVSDFAALQGICNQMMVMGAVQRSDLLLRGQMEWLPETKEILFVGTPWFGSMDQVITSQLSIHDFALHDPMIDLLHVLKSQEITNNDLKQLLHTVNKQKNELKKAAKTVEDIARFPMENPDPLVRVTFDGEVLMMNPAAEKLLKFDYRNESYNPIGLWRTIAEELDHDAERWMFEADSNGRTFSFICKPIVSERYFNVYGRDVTAQHETEKNLLISEQNFRVMGENIPGLIYLWRLNYDGTSKFEYMSPRMEAEIGVPMSQLEEMGSYIHPDDVTEWAAQVQEAFVHNKPFEYNGRLLLPNGEVVWMQAASRVAYEDEKGKVFSGFFRNVTEQRKQQLEYERLSLVASTNANGVLFTSPDGRITWANDGFLKMTGYSKDELIGKTPIELCQGPLTDLNTLRDIVGSFFKGEAFQAETVYYRKDGTWFWGRSKSQPVKNEKCELLEFFGIIEDISLEREQAERLKVLSKIAEENINPVIIANAEGKITWVNKSFTTLTGYQPEEVLGKKPGHLLQGPDTNPETAQYLRKQISSGQAFSAEILNYSKSGQPYWLRILGQPIYDDKGELSGFFALEEDVTREKEISKRIQESENRLRLALERIGDNVWEHDFKTGKTFFSKEENEFLGRTLTNASENSRLWWEAVHPDDSAKLAEQDALYKAGTIDSHSAEYRMIGKDGALRWVLDRGIVIAKDPHGLPLRIIGTHTDITAIKMTEMELAQRVRQFKTLAENIPGVIYEYEFWDDGREGLRYISPAIEKIFGIFPDEFRNFNKYIHPDDQERIARKNREAREHLTPFYDESRLVVPGRGIIWRSVQSAFSYRTEEGANVFTGFMLDITNQKNAENELQEQRRFYEGILNNMPADIAVFNSRHEYLFVNPRGIKDPELRQWIIGKRDEDYCAYRNKPLSLAADRRAHFEQVIKQKAAFEWEEQMVNADGEPEYLLRRWYPVLNEAGEVSLVIGYGVDITKRKLAEDALRINEEKYRSIIANINLGLTEMDAEGVISYVNPRLADMVGMTQEELIGQSAFQFVSAQDRTAIAERLKRRKAGISEAYEFQPVLRNKKNKWWLQSAAPRYNSKGEIIGSIVVSLDITRQKKLQMDLEESREQAEQLAKTKETFLANMSHEIRTPMNAILGLSRQLNKTVLNEQQRFYLEAILTASDNLLVIINDILDLSKIEAGKLSLENIGFSPRDLLAQVSQMLMHRAEEKGLWMQVNIDEGVGPVVIGDPYRINQVMLNLAGNAIKFTPSGGITMSVHLMEEMEGRQKLQFSVADTGIGISEEFKANMFDAFAQEYRSTSRNFGGTGLGLAISRQLVELMDGQFFVESEKDKGAIFSFQLWLPKGSEADLAVSKEHKLEQDILQGKHILLVEDNSMNRLVASTILAQYGARVTEAENGQIAVDMLSAGLDAFDLVLMDMQMPVMDGITATRRIRSVISAGLPVIALTANALPSEKAHCLESGMNDFISKPFDETVFIQTIAHWLGINAGGNLPPARPATPVPAAVPAPAPMPAASGLYSLKALESISRGNVAFVQKMVQMFCDQAPALAEEMHACLQNGSLERMGAVAHKLKPTIDSMEMTGLKEVIRLIEKAGKGSEVPADLTQWVETTVQQVVAVAAELKNKHLK